MTSPCVGWSSETGAVDPRLVRYPAARELVEVDKGVRDLAMAEEIKVYFGWDGGDGEPGVCTALSVFFLVVCGR